MTDVAIRAGVSQSTVSLVLNGTAGVRLSAATRERVAAAAAELGYRLPGGRAPLAAGAGAEAASTSASPGTPRRAGARRAGPPLIVYLADEISTSPHPVVTIDGAKDEAWGAGAVVTVVATRGKPEVEAAALQALLDHPALVGVIVAAVFTRATTVPAALDGVPTVLLNCYEGTPADAAPPRRSSVVPAEVAGGHAATERLIEAGHRRIALINGEPWMDAAQDRLKGYRRALASHDIAYDARLVKTGDWHVATGYDATLALMKERQPPTAIFCANDLMAVGCLEALQLLRLKVPQDVSVIGYDDQEIARHTHPPLTTLELPNYEMGRLAVELLLAERAGADAARRRIKVEGRIVERQTVGPPAGKPRAR
jgi:LacI family transcriptional regulator